jgi:hypothetical protein
LTSFTGPPAPHAAAFPNPFPEKSPQVDFSSRARCAVHGASGSRSDYVHVVADLPLRRAPRVYDIVIAQAA